MTSETTASPSVISFVTWDSTTVATPATSASTVTPSPTTYAPGSDLHYPPMTTPWSRPDGCTWTYDVAQEMTSGMVGPIAWLDLEPKEGHSSLSCYPPGMFTEGRTGVFSPASCPSGWTTFSLHRNTDEPKESATTTAVCCSSEYTLNGNHCYREIPTVLAVPILYNSSGSTFDILAEETSVLVSATLAVHTIRALFQEEDKAILGITDEDEINTESRSEGLTLSERVGIGVGAAIFVILLVGIGAFFFFRRRAKKQGTYPPHEMQIVDGRGNIGHDMAVSHPSMSPYGGATTLAGSLTDDDSRDDDAFDGEIEVLRAQKAAIQRRIEELESVETPSDLGHDAANKKV